MAKHIILWTLSNGRSEVEKKDFKEGMKDGHEGLMGKMADKKRKNLYRSMSFLPVSCLRLLIGAAILCAATAAVQAAGGRKARHVVLIGLDGWGSYSVEKADMPNVKGLMEKGAYTLSKRSVLPSSSAVNWASMFMGAGPELHGYTEWGSKVPELPSRTVDEDGIFPTVFGLLHRAAPEAEIGCIYEWEGIRYVVDTLALTHDYHVADYESRPEATALHAAAYIKEKRPALCAIIFDEPDHVGHQIGHDTEEYYAKLKVQDKWVGMILDAIEEAGMADETIVIVTADHGGINKGHGGKTMREMETPFIICGKGVKQGYQDTLSMMQFDCASTIAYIFGLPQPQVWIGRPMTQFFTHKKKKARR